MKYIQKKSSCVEAVQWFKHGDHPKITRFETHICHHCGDCMLNHGLIDQEDGSSYLICPKDFLIIEKNGDISCLELNLFKETYEEFDIDKILKKIGENDE